LYNLQVRNPAFYTWHGRALDDQSAETIQIGFKNRTVSMFDYTRGEVKLLKEQKTTPPCWEYI